MTLQLDNTSLSAFKAAIIIAVASNRSVTREKLIYDTFNLLDDCLTKLIREGDLKVKPARESHEDTFTARPHG